MNLIWLNQIKYDDILKYGNMSYPSNLPLTTKVLIYLLAFAFTVSAVSQNSKEHVKVLCIEAKRSSSYELGLMKADNAEAISKAIGFKEGILLSDFARLEIYKNFNDFKAGLQKSFELESKLSKPDDLVQLKIYKGLFYMYLEFYDKAQIEFNEALAEVKKVASPQRYHYLRGLIYIGLARNLNYRDWDHDNKDKVIFLNKAYSEGQYIKNKTLRMELMLSVNTIFFSLNIYNKNHKNAQKYLDSSLKILKDTIVPESFGDLSYQIGNMYYQLEDYKKAMLNYRKSIAVAKFTRNAFLLKDSYKGMIEVCNKIKDRDLEIKYLKILSIATDSIRRNEVEGTAALVHQMTKKIDTEYNVDRNTMKWYLLIMSIASLLLLYISWKIFRRYQSEKKRKEELEEILNDKMILVNSHESKLNPQKQEELRNVIRMAMANDMAFLEKFDNIFPLFRQNLLKLEVDLSENDLKFCRYLKLNFDTKEIARYGGQSVRAVESRKYRLRKKFRLSPEEDISLWFSNL